MDRSTSPFCAASQWPGQGSPPAFIEGVVSCKRHLGNMDLHSLPGVVHGADIARHDDPQRKPMFWSKGLIIHLIGQKHIQSRMWTR